MGLETPPPRPTGVLSEYFLDCTKHFFVCFLTGLPVLLQFSSWDVPSTVSFNRNRKGPGETQRKLFQRKCHGEKDSSAISWSDRAKFVQSHNNVAVSRSRNQQYSQNWEMITNRVSFKSWSRGKYKIYKAEELSFLVNLNYLILYALLYYIWHVFLIGFQLYYNKLITSDSYGLQYYF